MRAVQQQQYGGPETWTLVDAPRPEPSTGEVLVEVRAAAIDRGTWHLMRGLPYLVRLAMGLRRPRVPTPGIDLAGVVTAIGPGVTEFEVGAEVFGTTRSGSLAEYALSTPHRLAMKPANLTWEQAAAAPVSGITALQATYQLGRVRAGEQVLVLGASGGVGSYTVQLAVHAGAEVTAVASQAKAEFVGRLGAHTVIAYDRQEPDGRYDLIVDIGGNRRVRDLRRLLTDRGTLVLVGGEGGGRILGGVQRQVGTALLSRFVQQKLQMFVAAEGGDSLRQLADLLAAGVTPSVGATFPLAEAAEAMTYLESGQACGKVAIAVRQPTSPGPAA